MKRHKVYFAVFLAASVLLGFATGGRCLGEPPAAAPSTDIKTFDDAAKEIEKSMLALGYPKSTADELIDLVRGWNWEQWMRNLSDQQDPSASEFNRQFVTIVMLCKKIRKEFPFETKGFDLSVAVKSHKTNCLGYSQMFYVLGNSIGLSVRVIDVMEMVDRNGLSSGPHPDGGHAACLADLTTGQTVLVDVTASRVSGAFVFKERYVEVGNCWELKPGGNPLRLYPRIQIWDERGLLGALFNAIANRINAPGHYEEALPYYNKAIALNPKCATTISNRATAYNGLKKYEQAISDCNKAIEIDPKGAIPFCNRGNAYSLLGQHEQAMSDCNKAIELNPKGAMGYYGRGRVYRDLKQYEQAMSDFNKAIEINPQIAIFYNDRGRIYYSKKQYEQAVSDFSKVIELNPKSAIAYNDRGRAYSELKQYEQAMSDFSRAIELNPKYAIAYQQRGSLHIVLKQYEQAIEEISKAIELNPKSVAAFVNRGTAYRQLGQDEQAIADFSKAIELNPKHATAYYRRGLAYRSLGANGNAQADIAKAKRLGLP